MAGCEIRSIATSLCSEIWCQASIDCPLSPLIMNFSVGLLLPSWRTFINFDSPCRAGGKVSYFPFQFRKLQTSSAIYLTACSDTRNIRIPLARWIHDSLKTQFIFSVPSFPTPRFAEWHFCWGDPLLHSLLQSAVIMFLLLDLILCFFLCNSVSAHP